MRHPRRARWERKLKEVFDRIDGALEAEYRDRYDLHPARPPHGTTASRAHDGLFNIGAAFTAGYGSEHGRGYVVEVRMATLDRVPAAVRERIEEEVARRLETALAEAFPGRVLHVDRDGSVYKIHGDLSLGRL
jgi:hypothetical protein